MKNKVLKALLVIALTITLTIVDFVLVGANFITYALETASVVFNAHFKTDTGEEVSLIEYEMTNTEMKLYLEVEVKKGVSFNGVITLEDSNFKFKDTSIQGISQITENTITLEPIRAGNTVKIEVGIEPIIEENYKNSFLNKQSVLSLTGKYDDATEQNKEIDIEERVTLNLSAPQNTDTIFTGKVITNRKHQIGEETKRLVQIELNSTVINNVYPIEETVFEVTLPEKVEAVELISKGTHTTNGKAETVLEENEDYTWDKTNKQLQIILRNTSTGGKISWEKGKLDSVIVTLVLKQEINEEEYGIKSKVKLYGQEQQIEKAIAYNLAQESDGRATVSHNSNETIYKGKLYSKEDREYKTTTNLEINYTDISQSISINEKTVYRTEIADINTNNTEYKTTTISKAEFDKLIGGEGKILVKDQNGRQLREVSLADFDTSENVIITYSEGVKELNIEITKIEGTGILRLDHTKIIKADENLTKENIDKFEYLVEIATVKYESTENKFLKPVELKNTTSEVGLTVKNQTISSEGNKEIPLAITLKTDNEKYELFENPVFIVTMPEGITIESVTNGEESTLYGGLTISRLEPINPRQIKIELSGTQTKYVKSNINTQINFTAKVNVEKLMPNKIDKIKLQYQNKGYVYDIESEPINVIASNLKVVTHVKIDNYNGEGAILERYSDNSKKVYGELPIENTEEIETTLTYTVINNYDSEINSLQATEAIFFDNKGNQKILTSYGENNISIKPGEMKQFFQKINIPAGLYFGEKIDLLTLTEYTYSGTTYKLHNNINISTEGKQGLRDTSIIDEKLKIETFAQLGNGTALTEQDKIYDEQIIQYVIDVTNISNETISNLKITNRQDNGNIFDLEEVEVINFVESTEPYFEHRYAELKESEKSFTIFALNPGEIKQLICRVVAKKVEPENITTANISVSAENIEAQQIQTLTNTVKESNIKTFSRTATMQELKLYADSPVQILTYIENREERKIENLHITLYLSEGMTWKENYPIEALDIYDQELDLIENINYNEEENYITFNITQLEEGEQIVISSYLHMKSMPIEKLLGYEEVNVKVNDIISNSVKLEIHQLETTLDITQTVNIDTNQKVKNNQKIVFTGEIKNTGCVDSLVTIYDYMPTGLEISKIELIRKGEVIEKEKMDIVDIALELEKGETITINIEVIVNTSRITKEELTNKIWALPEVGEMVVSNEIKIKIESDIDNSQGEEIPKEDIHTPDEFEKPIETPDKPNIPDTPDNPDEPIIPEKPTYSISGNIWSDTNKNGTKEENEAIKDVTVKIIDINNQNSFLKDKLGNEIEVKTNSNGEYKIEGILEGKYSVIFKYNTKVYELAKNTNVKDYIIESTNEKVAITNNIDLNSNQTINVQLKELSKFDMEIDKYISKVIVQTKNGTKTSGYENKQLVREEISTKYLEGATVLVEYTIVVTNKGELEGYITEIIDYLPKDMSFHSELNNQWYKGEDGNLYNTSLANTIINPEESKEVKIVLLKTMNKANTGTTSNIVEISKTKNNKNYEDINLNNNQSKAEIIVNPATGVTITYLVAILNAIVIVAAGMYIIKRKIIGKGIK